MRLDRIFTSKHSKMIIKPIKMQIVFNLPIYGEPLEQYTTSKVSSTISMLADLGGYNLLRKK